jgi:monoamine oxidase
MLKKAYRLASYTNTPTAAPVDEWLDQCAENQSRRAFLRSSGQLAMVAGGMTTLSAFRPADLPPFQATNRANRKAPSLAIIGGGIAGLHAAHQLAKGGFSNFTIYEGSSRLGGRVRSAKNLIASNLVTELGGEFIESNHADMLALTREFGLSVVDLLGPSELTLSQAAIFFNGQAHSMEQVVAAFRPIAVQMQADIDSLPDRLDHTTTGGPGLRLDRLSMTAYLDSLGAQGLIRSLILTAYETEYGLSCDLQSALNLLLLVSTDTQQGSFDLFGSSSERYKIVDGNQQIIDRLAHRYSDAIRTGAILQSIGHAGSQYELTFDGHATVRADLVLLALPFSTLRQVAIRTELPALKRRAIQELGYGTNAKLVMGFSNRPWRQQGYAGYILTDNGLQVGWDSSQLQPTTAGSFTLFTGGQTGVQLGSGSPAQQAEWAMPRLDQIFPGAAAQYTGQAERFHWPSHPFSLGSYSAYTVGQRTTFGGVEGEAVGNLFFAGEHCSVGFQGFMNGGAETGRLAAQQILKVIA